MNARFACLFAIVLAVTVISPAQIKLDLRDLSEHGAPIRISGSISVEDDASERIRYTYRTTGSITNVSDKPILITAIRFNAAGLNAPPLQHEHEVDRFFSPEVLEPGHAEDIDLTPIPLGASSANGAPMLDEADPKTGPTATAEVTFVQFVDGTVWGDLDAGRRFLLSRKRNLEELRRLERLFREQGEEVFKDELMKANSTLEFVSIGALLYRCRSTSDSCLVSSLQLMVGAAEKHTNGIKKEGHLSVSGLAPE